jgi:hypothetical protein
MLNDKFKAKLLELTKLYKEFIFDTLEGIDPKTLI